MLQIAQTVRTEVSLARLAAPAGALKVINKNVQSMNRSPEPSLQAELDRLERENDVEGMIALYDYFVALTDANSAMSNMPRGSAVGDFLDAECNRFWSKAYAVADRLKRLKPTTGQREYHARTLIDAALALGGTLKDVVAIAQHLNEVGE